MGARVDAWDWSATPLGPIDQWPDALKTTAALVLNSPFPQALVWGAERITLHNDAFLPILGDKPNALGRPFQAVWSEAWDAIGPICDAAFAGEATFIRDYPLLVQRGNGPEHAYFTFSYSPVTDETGTVVGMLDTVMETTATISAMRQRRRLDFLDHLTRAVQPETDPARIMGMTTRMVADYLNVTNCSYADMDADRDGFTVRGDWAAPGSASLVGHYRLADFGTRIMADLHAGRPLVIHDIRADLSPQEAAAFHRIDVAATLCMPLVKEGRLTALMAISDRAPRAWSEDDLSMIAEVTERSWAHIERVRAESDLRRAQEAGGVGLFAVDIDSGLLQGTPQFFRLFGLEPVDSMPAAMVEALVLPEDAAIPSDAARRARGEGALDVEYRIRRPDNGEVRAIARKAEYERDAGGRARRLLGAVRDVTAEREMVQALAASEAQFRSLAEAHPNMVWSTSVDGSATWFNEAVHTYTGAEPGKLERGGWIGIIHPDDMAATGEQWQRALSTDTPFEAEYRLRRADGAYRWHLARAVTLRDESGTITRWIGTNTDIHERVLAEAASERDRERLWAMSQDLLLVCDAHGVITDVNPSATRILHWTPDEMIGHLVLDFLHPDDHARSVDEFRRIAAGHASTAFENRYRTKEGDYRLIDWSSVADGDRTHCVGRDITDNRSMAREQERIWTLSPVLKVVAGLDGMIVKVNPAWDAALGWSQSETAGRRLPDFVAEADRERAGAALERLGLGQSLAEEEFAFTAKARGIRQIAWNFVREGDRIFGFGRDITEQRSAEDALRQSQKMEAVGQLTGGIAHDFNNLLQGVTGNLELLQHRLDQGRMEGLERLIRGAATSASRASALTHRLLAFSRRQPLDPRPVRANPLVASMEDMLRRTLGETIDLEMVTAGGLWLTRCDPNQLESAVLNLAINARDAMPDGGKLVIETGNAHIDHAYAARLRDLSPGQYVCISVTDTGVGMDADTLARAFEPFFTTKPIGQGTGLGLSMIYGFARQSEGHAQIYSEPGQGTTVRLYLPRHLGEAVDDTDSPHLSEDHLAGEGETVLVVEDEPVVRGLIVEVLSELGYRAIEAVDGPTGLAVLRSQRRIDLLITDIGLPGLNGRQVADGGRAVRPNLRILFMTGYAENAALASGFLEPGMAMITKPFAMEALASRIRDMIGTDGQDRH